MSTYEYARRLVPILFAAACAGGDSGETDSAATTNLSGTIEADGSSTVYPITAAVAEDFAPTTGDNVRVTVAYSGTGGGFKRFCAGETPLSNASRPITDSERALCAQNGVEPIELQVAIDGLAVVVNPQNQFAECLTVAELKKVWEPASKVARWSEIRPEFPNDQLKLYGPGTNSGTFDYFTEVIVGTARASRGDYNASEDDNVLVQGVAGDRSALGYFGFAYFMENQSQLKAVAVDNGAGCVRPSAETVTNGQYAPLSRPLFVYVSRAALQRPEVVAFLRYYMEHAAELVPEVGYIPLAESQYQQNLSQLPQGGTT